VNRFASGLSRHPLPAVAAGEVAGELLDALGDDDPDLLCCFASPHHLGAFDDIVASVREVLDPGTLLAQSASSIIGGPREVEDEPALAAFAARLPESTVKPVGLQLTSGSRGLAIAGWPEDAPAAGARGETLLLFADPFSFPADSFLGALAEEGVAPELSVVGGLASAGRTRGGNRLALDDEIRHEGAVGAFVSGAEVRTVVSQGCRPVGEPLVVTAAEGNVIVELGSRPALARLRETAEASSERDRELLRRGLHLGIVVDEQRDEFERGDFLVRNVVGVDAAKGSLAIGDIVEVGRTVQFHVRDAVAADEDLREMVANVDRAGGALLFTCNGRGRNLFHVPDHDAGTVDRLLGPLPLAGCFCAGEIGPVGGRNFLHGFTASLAVFPS